MDLKRQRLIITEQKVKAAKGYAGKVTIMYLDAVLSPEKSGYYIYDSVTKTFSKYIQIAQRFNIICDIKYHIFNGNTGGI